MPENLPAAIHTLMLLYTCLAAIGAFFFGILFFFKRTGQHIANNIFGTMLLLCGGVQLHFIFAYGGWLTVNPTLGYLPIYFSLAIPVLFFYYVKFSLYPKYRLRPSDAKHFMLPLGQFIYLFAIFFIASWRIPGGRYFYNPFYGGFEQALFIVLFPAYIIFGYQYFRRRRKQLKQRSLPRSLWYIHKLIKGTMLFILAYAILGLSDFVILKLFHLNLREYYWFAAISAGSFSSLVLFFCVYAFQVLLWGRQLLKSNT